MSDTTGPPPAGWYPDGQGSHRWWDGSAWTEQTGGSPGAPAPGLGGSDSEATQVRPGPLPGQGYPQQGYPQQGYPGPAPGAAWTGFPGGPGLPPGPQKTGVNKVLVGAIVGAVALVVVLVGVLALTLGGDEPDDAASDPTTSDGPSAEESSSPEESEEPSEEPSDEGDAGSGGGVPAGDPATAAEGYLEARDSGDFVTVCELSSREQRETYLPPGQDDCSAMDLSLFPEPVEPPDGFEFSFFTEVTEQDDTSATVEFGYFLTNGDIDSREPDDEPTGRLTLVPEDDQWRVDDEEYIG